MRTISKKKKKEIEKKKTLNPFEIQKNGDTVEIRKKKKEAVGSTFLFFFLATRYFIFSVLYFFLMVVLHVGADFYKSLKKKKNEIRSNGNDQPFFSMIMFF